MFANFFPILRLVLALVFAAWSSLIFLRAQKIFLFQLTIGATEYGHWLAAICLLLTVLGGKKNVPSLLATFLLLVSALIFSWPLIQAFRVAAGVPAQVEAAFPTRLPNVPALSFAKLWRGSAVRTITPQTLTFATHQGADLRMLFYPPGDTARPGPVPCVLVLHTGGWANGSPDEFNKMNSWLAGQGYAVAAIQYRLAPRWRWPAQRDDVLDALHYLQTHSASLGLDPTRFVLFGRSAGGQIAEAVACGCPDPAVRGCIAFYAPADLIFAYRYATPGDILNSLKLLIDYTGGTPETVPENYRTSSSLFLVNRQTLPILLMHGVRDEMVWVRQSRRLDARLAQNGTRHLYLELPWATHAFDFNFDGPGGQISRYAIQRFLANVLPVENAPD